MHFKPRISSDVITLDFSTVTIIPSFLENSCMERCVRGMQVRVWADTIRCQLWVCHLWHARVRVRERVLGASTSYRTLKVRANLKTSWSQFYHTFFSRKCQIFLFFTINLGRFILDTIVLICYKHLSLNSKHWKMSKNEGCKDWFLFVLGF